MTHFQDVVCCQFQTGSAWQLVLLFPDEPETLPTLFFFFKAPRAVPAAAFPPPPTPSGFFRPPHGGFGGPLRRPPIRRDTAPPPPARCCLGEPSRGAGGTQCAAGGGSWLAYPRHSPRLRRAPEAALPAPLTRGARPRGSSPTRAGLLAFPPPRPPPGPAPSPQPPETLQEFSRRCGAVPTQSVRVPPAASRCSEGAG